MTEDVIGYMRASDVAAAVDDRAGAVIRGSPHPNPLPKGEREPFGTVYLFPIRPSRKRNSAALLPRPKGEREPFGTVYLFPIRPSRKQNSADLLPRPKGERGPFGTVYLFPIRPS